MIVSFMARNLILMKFERTLTTSERSKVLIIPIIALEAYNMASTKPMDSKPVFGLLKKSSRKVVTSFLVFASGVISRITRSNSVCIFFATGK
jgi:hypothetical protein